MVSLERVSFFSLHLTGSNQPCRYQGKTACLYFKIIESLIERRPFLYQTKDGGVYHASEKGVEAVQQWSSNEPIMAFFDSDNSEMNGEPKSCLFHYSVQIIGATSPRGAYRGWLKQIMSTKTVFTKLAIGLWSARELIVHLSSPCIPGSIIFEPLQFEGGYHMLRYDEYETPPP